jgi:hypothetical protein
MYGYIRDCVLLGLPQCWKLSMKEHIKNGYVTSPGGRDSYMLVVLPSFWSYSSRYNIVIIVLYNRFCWCLTDCFITHPTWFDYIDYSYHHLFTQVSLATSNFAKLKDDHHRIPKGSEKLRPKLLIIRRRQQTSTAASRGYPHRRIGTIGALDMFGWRSCCNQSVINTTCVNLQ